MDGELLTGGRAGRERRLHAISAMFLVYVAWTAPAWGQPKAATPPEPVATGSESVAPGEAAFTALLRNHRDAFGRACDSKEVAVLGELRFVACGLAGVWVVRVTAHEALWGSSQDVGGSADAFFVRRGRLWVELGGGRAVDLGVTAPAVELSEHAAVAPSPAQEAAVPASESNTPAAATPAHVGAQRSAYAELIRVVSVLDDGLIVSLGASPGLVPGVRLAFYPPASRGVHAAETALRSPEPLAVGQLVAVSEQRGRVALGTNERVPVGAWARPTMALASASAFAPPRAAGVWELAFVARPFLVLDNLGAGVFIDARAGYRFVAPLHVEALIAPFALASARTGATTPFGGLLSAAFDTRLFEVGLGLGVQTVNDPAFGLDRGTGTLIAQRLRLGALDGAHLEAITYVVLFHSEFTFSSVRVEARIPLGSRSWLHAAGGGGSLGLGYGELGLRVLTSGYGGPGSFFLTAVVGGVHVFEGCNVVNLESCQPLSYIGPMVGVGGEWRL